MFIERPPGIFRLTVPGGFFRGRAARGEKFVYLTFDDGPIPEVTPWVLDMLDRYGIKATFFMVGDNVRRNPDLYAEVLRRGHSVGNHTMHHVKGSTMTCRHYLRDVAEAAAHIDSDLFRPPHGWLRPRQTIGLRNHFRIVMFDLVTRDYSKKLNADDVVKKVRNCARPGSVIVFHDSLKSWPQLQEALPRALDWLIEQGYQFRIIERWQKQSR